MKLLKMMFLIIIFCMFSEGVLAYETFTHELITIRSSVKSTNYQKFKADFGIDGKEKLKEGSAQEDTSEFFRPFNHFYDPNDGRGLNIAGEDFGRAAKGWGYDGGSGSTWGPDVNNYSWTKAREYMYLGLTSATESDRNKNLNYMFRSVGQVIHLVQDLAQPSHTRNDAHPSYKGLGDSSQLEKWAVNNSGTVVGFFSSAGAPQDLGSYDTYFDEFAYFSNQNFFSDDTVFSADYPFPSKAETDYGDFSFDTLVETYIAEDGKEDKVVYITKTVGSPNGYKLAQAGYFAKDVSQKNLNSYLQFHIDDNVAEDNARILIPKAVEYSAGLLDYFFRGKMEVNSIKSGDLSISVTNLSEEDMTGDFELYYDNSGSRIFIQTWNMSIPAGGSVPLDNPAFPSNFAIGQKEELILVFQGELGSEQGAVATTSFTASPSLYVEFELPDGNVIYWDIDKDAQANLTNASRLTTTNFEVDNIFYQEGYYLFEENSKIIGSFDCPRAPNIFEITFDVTWRGYDYNEELVFMGFVDNPVGIVSAESNGSFIRDEFCGAWAEYTGEITNSRYKDYYNFPWGRENKSGIGAFGYPGSDSVPKVIFGVFNSYDESLYEFRDSYSTSCSGDRIHTYVDEYRLFAYTVKDRVLHDKKESEIMATRISERRSLHCGSGEWLETGNRIWMEKAFSTGKSFNENQMTSIGYFRVNGPPPGDDPGYTNDGDVESFIVNLWAYDFDGSQFNYNISRRVSGLEGFLTNYAPEIPVFSGMVRGNIIR